MMQRIRKSMAQKEQGFTLIELLVVIIIIGILAAIAIPVFLNQRKKGVDAGIKADLKNTATTVESWVTDNPTAVGPVALTATDVKAVALVTANPDWTAPKITTGNTVTVETGTDHYCLTGYNSGASTAKTAATGMLYDSGAGGLISAPTAAQRLACVA